MVERYVAGRELTCAVMGGEALGITEIVVEGGAWYDFNAKYAAGGSTHICPAVLPLDVEEKILRYSETAHRAIGCRGVTRSDFRYDPATGELIWLEINTQPGMTPTSLLPEIAAHRGISFQALVSWIVEDASLKR
jgi:D-alanine-D-alanine ligase